MTAAKRHLYLILYLLCYFSATVFFWDCTLTWCLWGQLHLGWVTARWDNNQIQRNVANFAYWVIKIVWLSLFIQLKDKKLPNRGCNIKFFLNVFFLIQQMAGRKITLNTLLYSLLMSLTFNDKVQKRKVLQKTEQLLQFQQLLC